VHFFSLIKLSQVAKKGKNVAISEELVRMIAHLPNSSLEELLRMTPNDAYSIFRQQFERLEGVPIGRSDAAKKYDVNRESIARWIKAGMVRQYQSSSRGQGVQTIVDERDVAVMAKMSEVYRGSRPGKIKGWNPQSPAQM